MPRYQEIFKSRPIYWEGAATVSGDATGRESALAPASRRSPCKDSGGRSPSGHGRTLGRAMMTALGTRGSLQRELRAVFLKRPLVASVDLDGLWRAEGPSIMRDSTKDTRFQPVLRSSPPEASFPAGSPLRSGPLLSPSIPPHGSSGAHQGGSSRDTESDLKFLLLRSRRLGVASHEQMDLAQEALMRALTTTSTLQTRFRAGVGSPLSSAICTSIRRGDAAASPGSCLSTSSIPIARTSLNWTLTNSRCERRQSAMPWPTCHASFASLSSVMSSMD